MEEGTEVETEEDDTMLDAEELCGECTDNEETNKEDRELETDELCGEEDATDEELAHTMVTTGPGEV